MNVSSDQYVYIVDAYSPYARNTNVLYRFLYHDQWWAIRRIALEWGKPNGETMLEFDDTYSRFRYYDTFEQAMAYVRELRKGEQYGVYATDGKNAT